MRRWGVSLVDGLEKQKDRQKEVDIIQMAQNTLLADFTVEDEQRAYSLLSVYGFSRDLHWGEARRFALYDSLSRIAFELADEAVKSSGTEANRLYKESNVAQCAMDIVARQGPFTPDTLAKLREPANDR